MGKSTQLSQAGIDSIDTVPISETNLTAAGCKLSKKFSRWGPQIQEAKDHHAAAKNTDYRNRTLKRKSGHPTPDTVVYGKHQKREVQLYMIRTL